SPAGSDGAEPGVSAAGAAGMLSSAAGTCDWLTVGTVAAGTWAAPSGAAGASGTCAITPRSVVAAAGALRSVACQAMYRLIEKNTIASHLVALVRKLDAPRAPNTVAEAPPPKPAPACAPAPRCMRISATIAIATSR